MNYAILVATDELHQWIGRVGVRIKLRNGKCILQCFKVFRFKVAKISEFQAYFFNLCLSWDLGRGLVLVFRLLFFSITRLFFSVTVKSPQTCCLFFIES